MNVRRMLVLGMLDGGVGVVTYETPAYGNAGGMGDRRSIITVTSNGAFFDNLVDMPPQLVDGNTDSYLYTANAAPVAGKYIKFLFQHKVIITEAKWWQGDSQTIGTVKWQLSVHDDATLVDVGGSFSLEGLGGVGYATQTSLAGNTIPAKAYYIAGVSGNTNWNQIFSEVQFKIANPT